MPAPISRNPGSRSGLAQRVRGQPAGVAGRAEEDDPRGHDDDDSRDYWKRRKSTAGRRPRTDRGLIAVVSSE